MEDGINSVYVLTMGTRKMFSSKEKTPDRTPDKPRGIKEMNFYCTENAE